MFSPSIQRRVSIRLFIEGTAPNKASHKFQKLVNRSNLQPARRRGKYPTCVLVYVLYPDGSHGERRRISTFCLTAALNRSRKVYKTQSADCRSDIGAPFGVFASTLNWATVAVFHFGSVYCERRSCHWFWRSAGIFDAAFNSQTIFSGSQDRFFFFFPFCYCAWGVIAFPASSFENKQVSREASSHLLTNPDVSVSHLLEFIDCVMLFPL